VPREEVLYVVLAGGRWREDGKEDPDVGVEVVGDQVSNSQALALSL
jgi:hypothetical protein